MSARNDQRGLWHRDGIFLVLLLLIFTLRYLSPFLRADLFGPFQDNIWIYGPIFSKAAEIAHQGCYPYWLDTMLTGFPLFDSPHFSTTYPFYFFRWLSYGIELDSVLTLTRLTYLHLLILYLNSYVMIRLAGAGGFGALCGATVALVSGSTTGCATWITIIASYSWLPLLIGSAIWIVKRPHFGSILLLTASASLLITASPAQSLIHSLLFCACFFVCALFWCAKNLGTDHTLKVIRSLLLALVFVAALTGVATIPMTIDTASMIRHVGERTAVTGHQRIPWNAFITHQLEPAQLWNIFADSRPLGIIGGPYIGALGVAGIALSWMSLARYDRFERFLVIFASLFAIYGLLAGLGTHMGMTQLHYHLPLLNRIREAGRHLVWFTTFGGLLTGLGVDNIGHRFRVSLPVVGTAIVVSTLWIVELVTAYRADRLSWLPLCAIPIGLLLLYVARVNVTVLTTIGLVLSCVAAAIAYNGTTPQYLAAYYDSSNLSAFRIIRRLTNLPDIQASRVAFRDSALAPGNWAMDASFYGIKSFYMNMTPVPYTQFLDMNRESLPNYRELMGANYLVCGQKGQPRSNADTLLFEDGGYRVYKLAHSMSPAVLVHDLAGNYSNAPQFYAKLSQGFDYSRVAYVAESDYARVKGFLRQAPGPAPGPPDFLQLVKRDFNGRLYCANTPIPSLLILNEYYNKAWQIRVNDRVTLPLRVNLNQIGVLLRQGRNIVQFEYKPMLFWRLLILQRVTLVLLLLLTAARAYLSCWHRRLDSTTLVEASAVSP